MKAKLVIIKLIIGINNNYIFNFKNIYENKK